MLENNSVAPRAVALCLATIARLQLAFAEASGMDAQRKLLFCSADYADKTQSSAELYLYRRALADMDDVEFLITHRQHIDFVPQAEWKKRRVTVLQYPKEHADKLKLVDRLLKNETKLKTRELALLKSWFKPVLEKYPTLEQDLGL